MNERSVRSPIHQRRRAGRVVAGRLRGWLGGDPQVNAIGLYIEVSCDVSAFARAA